MGISYEEESQSEPSDSDSPLEDDISLQEESICMYESDDSPDEVKSPVVGRSYNDETVPTKKIRKVNSRIVKNKLKPKKRLQRSRPALVGAASDGAWMRRGNGKCSTSRIGHAELIGVLSGKIMAYDYRINCCYYCDKEMPHVVCYKNWTGSSKAMESDMIAKMIAHSKPLQEANVRVVTLVGDEDSSTMARVREEVEWVVGKVTDTIHSKKNFFQALVPLRAMHKELSFDVLLYLQDCFSKAVHQKKNSPEALSKAIMNIPCHVFSVHDQCGDWCGYLKDPSNYKHKRLPSNWPEYGSNLQMNITAVCQRFASKCTSLAPCQNSQVCESHNSTVARKAPKNNHYPRHFVNRQIIALLQKNESLLFDVKIRQHFNLSPGVNSITYKERAAKEKEARRKKASLPESKKKRRKFTLQPQQHCNRMESKEGTSYSSGMGFANPSTSAASDEHAASKDIPPEIVVKNKRKRNVEPRTPPTNSYVFTPIENTHDNHIIIDVETTGGSDRDQVIQISALSPVATLNVYLLPTMKMNFHASEVTGIKKIGNKLYLNNSIIQTVSRQEGWERFKEYCKLHIGNIVFIGQNVKFDAKFIVRELLEFNLYQDLQDQILGFIDTLPLFRELLPNLSSHAEKSVVLHIMGPDYTYEAHNALADVTALRDVLLQMAVDNEQMTKHSMTSVSFIQYLNMNMHIKKLVPLQVKRKVTKSIINAAKVSKQWMEFRKTAGDSLLAGREFFAASNALWFKQETINGIVYSVT